MTRHIAIVLVPVLIAGCATRVQDLATIPRWTDSIAVEPGAHDSQWQITPPADTEGFTPSWQGAQWNTRLELANGVTARLKGESKPFGNITLHYSDENGPRTVYQYADYIYVQEIRLSPDRSTLFVKVTGMCPRLIGSWDYAALIVYDLRDRERTDLIRLKEAKADAKQDAWTHTLKSRASRNFPRMVRHGVRPRTYLTCNADVLQWHHE